MFQALNPVTLISLQSGLQYSPNITLELFRTFWTGPLFEYHLKICEVLKTRYSLMKQKLEILCIATAAHIYGFARQVIETRDDFKLLVELRR